MVRLQKAANYFSRRHTSGQAMGPALPPTVSLLESHSQVDKKGEA